MLLFSKIKSLIITFAFCYLFQKVNLIYYISFKLYKVDDCVRYINISNQILFNYNPEYYACDPYFNDRSYCDPGNFSIYPSDRFIIKNYEYEFKTEIEITFEDWNHIEGYMRMNVYFNEYKIKPTDQAFWRCDNCINENHENNYYLSSKDGSPILSFHPKGNNECGHTFYTFSFKIDDINELYKGGQNGKFETNSDYYTFPEQLTFEKTVNYSEGDVELELINFNLEDIIYSKSNQSLVFKNNDFNYKINYDDNIEGKLKGLGLDDVIKNISKEESIKFTDTLGLNYTLGDNEKQANFTEIRVKISVFKNCPNDTNQYPYCDRSAIIEEKEFIFKINIIRPP